MAYTSILSVPCLQKRRLTQTRTGGFGWKRTSAAAVHEKLSGQGIFQGSVEIFFLKLARFS